MNNDDDDDDDDVSKRKQLIEKAAAINHEKAARSQAPPPWASVLYFRHFLPLNFRMYITQDRNMYMDASFCAQLS